MISLRYSPWMTPPLWLKMLEGGIIPLDPTQGSKEENGSADLNSTSLLPETSPVMTGGPVGGPRDGT
jgi:hypothetical protein